MSDWSNSAHHPFPSTHWSAVTAAAAGQGSDELRRAALTRLLGQYAAPMRGYLLRSMRVPPDRVEDLLQRFVADKILEQDLLGRAAQARGRFRSFLVAALQRFVLNCLREERALKRSPGAAWFVPDAALDVADAEPRPDDGFDTAWARQVLDNTVERMRDQCHARPDIWGVFEGRVLMPTLLQAEPVPYARLVERYGFESPAQASNVLVTANRMFLRLLRDVIGQYEMTEEEIDAEIRDLKNILSRVRAGRR